MLPRDLQQDEHGGGLLLGRRILWIHWPTSSRSWSNYPLCQAVIFLPLSSLPVPQDGNVEDMTVTVDDTVEAFLFICIYHLRYHNWYFIWFYLDRPDTCRLKTWMTVVLSPGASRFCWITRDWREQRRVEVVLRELLADYWLNGCQSHVFKEYKNANGDSILEGDANWSVSSQIVKSGSRQGAYLHRAVSQRHLHQTRDSNPADIS